MKVISDCHLLLDYLPLEFGDASLPSYCEIDFSYRYFFKVTSLLRGVKNVQVTWGRIAYNLVLASGGPEKCAEYFTQRLCYWVPSGSENFRKYLDSVNQQYCDVLDRVFSELTSRLERRIGSGFLRYKKKQKRHLPSKHGRSSPASITVGMLQQVLQQIRSPTRRTIHSFVNGVCLLQNIT